MAEGSRPSAKVILDSISPGGVRLTTMEVKIHRFVLAELNTHRAFSRNSASSRAIPVAKQIERVLGDPAMPIEWGLNEPGMQAGAVADEETALHMEYIWRMGLNEAVRKARRLNDLGLHKQVVNRLLEPFMWHTVIISSTEWDNFWAQRCTKYSVGAMPEMRAAADAMHLAYGLSVPSRLDYGVWHTPYVFGEEIDSLHPSVLRMVSAARCARVSYLTHDGVRDWQQDVDLYTKLISAKPRHESPLEHVATPVSDWNPPGNFHGWHQLRHQV